MYGLELIKQAFALKETERVPWVPFVGVHGAHLLKVNAREYLQSADLMYQGVKASIEAYKPDGIPAAFDLQIEAEALGCRLEWSDENPPAVVSHPLQEGKSMQDLNPFNRNAGRIPLVMETARRIKAEYPEIALYGLITGPFTLALHLLGTDIFIRMMEDPEGTQEILSYGNQVATKMAGFYMDAGCDVIAVVDPMTSQIDPMSFETFITPPVTELFDSIRSKNALSSFFVCGYAQQNIEAMSKCRPDNISIDENIPLDYVKEVTSQQEISFGGNLKLTLVLLMGTPLECQKHAWECMQMAGKKGFILAPGCDLPMNTPRENLEAITELVHSEYQQHVVDKLQSQPEEITAADLSGHWQPDKVVVDVITLDSSSCAPCQYMVEAVKHAAAAAGAHVIWHEHSIKKKEGIQMMVALGIKSLPTIAIEGNAEFISHIPPKNQLMEKIDIYWQKKQKQP
jgi:uroporphyrinogen decarboxylase